MKRLATLLLVVVMAASFLFAGCAKTPAAEPTVAPSAGEATEAPKATEAPASTSAYPGTMTAGSVTFNLGSEPPKMNSLLATDTNSFTLFRHLLEGLTTLDPQNLVQPGMAESWDVSDDKLTYTFHLRDAKWSNGDAVTANDFKFAWMTVLNPDTAAGYNYMRYVIKGAQEYNTKKGTAEDVGIEVVDEKTLKVTLAAPTPYFLDLCAFGTFMPLNETFYKQYGDQYATEASNMLYNGPWTMTSWEHESKIVMTKNPDYYNAAEIKIDELVALMITDSNVAMNTFKSGEADMIGLNGEQSAEMKGAGETVQSYSDGSSWALAFNLTDKTMANANVRKALTLAIDRQSFITNVLKNNSSVSYSWNPAVINNGDKVFKDQLPNGAKYFNDADIEGAKAALELAKTELGVDTISVELLMDEGDTGALTAAYYQDCWKKAGIECTITQVPFKDRLARQDNKEYQVSSYGWGPDYNDPMTFLDLWVSGSGNNIIGLNDATYDKNIADALVEADYDKRTAMLVECENTLIENFYLGPVYFRQRDFITSGKLQGVVRTAFQDVNFRWASIVE
ncbi:MAG: peptide ABC transporter substrate-binding protein [Eubacteriales bacterium]|nr:peptide ABC transporter substrate-binding protein [Eubacteriales bacterium]